MRIDGNDIARDDFDLIIQRDGDGGDTLHRMATFGIGSLYSGQIGSAEHTLLLIRALLEIRPGHYIRHPDKSKWYSAPYTVTVDQLVPLWIFLGMMSARGHYAAKQMLFEHTIKLLGRGLFAFNSRTDSGRWTLPDWALPRIAPLIRAWRFALGLNPIVYAIGFLFQLLPDFFFLIGTIFKVMPWRWDDSKWRFKRVDPGDCDDFNQVLSCLQAASFSTWFTDIATAIYTFQRPKTWASIESQYLPSKGLWTEPIHVKDYEWEHPLENNRVMGALIYYCRITSGGNPGLAEMLRKKVEMYFDPGDP